MQPPARSPGTTPWRRGSTTACRGRGGTSRRASRWGPREPSRPCTGTTSGRPPAAGPARRTPRPQGVRARG
eukprot:6292269-Pyramimonas_sp.AAC.1